MLKQELIGFQGHFGRQFWNWPLEVTPILFAMDFVNTLSIPKTKIRKHVAKCRAYVFYQFSRGGGGDVFCFYLEKALTLLVSSLSASLLLNIFLSFEVGIAHAIANFKWKENTSSLKN